MSEDFSSIRERLIDVLADSPRPLTVSEIAVKLGLGREYEARLYEDLIHASKSLRRRSGGRLCIAMIPPVCNKCGYVFKDIKRPRKPSRCPRCGSEWISPPKFTIRRA